MIDLKHEEHFNWAREWNVRANSSLLFGIFWKNTAWAFKTYKSANKWAENKIALDLIKRMPPIHREFICQKPWIIFANESKSKTNSNHSNEFIFVNKNFIKTTGKI